MPTISGKNIKNFRDIYSILTRANASKIVTTKQELYSVIDGLLSNDDSYRAMVDACKNVFESQKGAIDFVIDKIKQFV